ncbi:MAG: ATP-binding protein [Verrucomicrobiota bacterium]
MNQEITEQAAPPPAPKRSSFLARYKATFLAIALFVAINLVVLGINFYTAVQLAEDAVNINVAGRQRMLSQRIPKILLKIEDDMIRNVAINKELDELNGAYDIFENTLKSFDIGGFTTDPTGKQITISAVTSPEARQAVENGKKIWEPLREILRPILISQSGTIDQEILDRAILFSYDKNLELLAEMNNLTVALEQEADQKTTNVRWIQTIALLILIGILAFIVYDFVTRIRRGDVEIEEKATDLENAVRTLRSTTDELESSQRETDTILKTVRQGLLLIDSQYQISSKYSEELKIMFRMDDLSGMSFLGIMKRILTEKDYYTCRDYMELLFNPKKREKTLIKVNPMEEAEVNFQERSGQFITKYFGFQFKRIMSDEGIESVFVSVRDVTEQVELTRRLKESEEKKDAQFNMLLAILNVDPDDIEDFCSSSIESLQHANSELKPEDFVGKKELTSPTELREKLNAVFRHVHSIKGNASLLGIEYFVEMTHGIEDTIGRIRNKPKLSGEDFLGVVSLLAECKEQVEECQDLGSKMSTLGGSSRNKAKKPLPEPPEMKLSPPSPPGLANGQPKKVPTTDIPAAETSLMDTNKLEKLVESLSDKTGKKVNLKFELKNGVDLSDKQRKVLRDSATQFIRNSFAHGIEGPEERTNLGKSPEGTITIGMEKDEDNGGFKFFYMDDGAGLDSDKIRERALAKHLVDSKEAEEKEDYEWWFYIFEPGFSTAENTDEIGGRGVGLDIIRHSVMEDLGGEIFLCSEPHKYCRFDIEVPEKQTNGGSA